MAGQDGARGPWVDELAAVLAERWASDGRAAGWLFTYAEIGHIAEAFPGTSITLAGGMPDAGGVIRLQVQIVSPSAMPTRPHANGHGGQRLMAGHSYKDAADGKPGSSAQ